MFRPEFALAQDVAKKAGRLIKESCDKDILSADGKDIKMLMDKESEAFIIDLLSESFDYPILSEESGYNGTGEIVGIYWIVDPIDGTMNYSRGNPSACVSIALWKDDEPILGVIYNFYTDEMFYGCEGEGVFLNGEPLHKNSVPKNQAILATGFPTYLSDDEDNLVQYIKLIKEYKKVRMIGSAALSIAYVVAGRFDAYMEHSIKLWDVAAGLALCKECGVYYEFERVDSLYSLNVFCNSFSN